MGLRSSGRRRVGCHSGGQGHRGSSRRGRWFERGGRARRWLGRTGHGGCRCWRCRVFPRLDVGRVRRRRRRIYRRGGHGLRCRRRRSWRSSWRRRLLRVGLGRARRRRNGGGVVGWSGRGPRASGRHGRELREGGAGSTARCVPRWFVRRRRRFVAKCALALAAELLLVHAVWFEQRRRTHTRGAVDGGSCFSNGGGVFSGATVRTGGGASVVWTGFGVWRRAWHRALGRRQPRRCRRRRRWPWAVRRRHHIHLGGGLTQRG